ncbi:MAG: hypothetical protein LUD15_06170 [Bacteroides sp.]|nr:hypothetical protein [Bacteroides sp.]
MKQLITLCIIIAQLSPLFASMNQEDPKETINKIKKSKIISTQKQPFRMRQRP